MYLVVMLIEYGLALILELNQLCLGYTFVSYLVYFPLSYKFEIRLIFTFFVLIQ